MKSFINVVTVVILFLVIFTIYSTSYNTNKEFFSGKTETLKESEPLSSIEFPLVLNIGVENLLSIEKSHRSFFRYFIGSQERDQNISQSHFLGWSNQNNNTSPSGANKSESY